MHEPRSTPSTMDSKPPELVLGGPILPADVYALADRLRLLLLEGHAAAVDIDVAALVDPDAGTLDALCRLALTARRHGCRVRLRHASRELRELVALAGLSGVVPCLGGSALQARRQAEEREEAGRVQEERDPADPVA